MKKGEKKKVLFNLVILVVLIILVSIIFLVKTKSSFEEGNPFECVPSQCCHASECVLKQDAPECTNSFCTAECREKTMDCGAGHCEYLNGKCEVVWDEK